MISERSAIVGLGLVGGSVGAALRRQGVYVQGYDVSVRHARIAAVDGLVDEVCVDLRSAVAGADTVILAVPVLRIIDLLPLVDAVSEHDALIMDMGSAKRAVLAVMAALPGAQRMVGGHPLAGKETSGPTSADSALFRSKPFFLVPTSQTTSESLLRAEEVVRLVGGVPIRLGAEEHDTALAATSHLPQILATLLASIAPASPPFTGAAFRDMTRLAESDPVLWRDVLLANADLVVDVGRLYAARLNELLHAVEAGDVATIEETIRRGRTARIHMGIPA